MSCEQTWEKNILWASYKEGKKARSFYGLSNKTISYRGRSVRTGYSTGFDHCSKRMLSHTISNYASNFSVLTSFVNEAVDFYMYFFVIKA